MAIAAIPAPLYLSDLEGFGGYLEVFPPVHIDILHRSLQAIYCKFHMHSGISTNVQSARLLLSRLSHVPSTFAMTVKGAVRGLLHPWHVCLWPSSR